MRDPCFFSLTPLLSVVASCVPNGINVYFSGRKSFILVKEILVVLLASSHLQAGRKLSFASPFKVILMQAAKLFTSKVQTFVLK